MRIGAFVLHLRRAEKRRANANKLIESCGLEAEIWPAVDGSKLPSSDVGRVVRPHLFDPLYPFELKIGEVGCFLSHRQIWAEIVRRDLDYGLVFEDDVSLDTEVFAVALDLAVRYVGDLGYVQLQNRPTTGAVQLIDRQASCTLTVPLVTPLRASAQVISRDAARQLVDRSERFDRPVDTYVQSHWATGIRPGVVFPSGVSTISDQLDGSTIQTGQKTAIQKFGREISRFRYRRAVKRFSARSTAPVPASTP